MRRVGIYTPETAKVIFEVVKYLRNSGFVVPRPGREDQFVPPDAPIYVRNDTGEEIPPFACLQTDGTVEDTGQNYVKVVKPRDTSGEQGWYLFNGIAPIEIGGYGIAYDGPQARMLTNGTTITNGERWAPIVNDFTIEQDDFGPFIAIGPDDIENDAMRGFIDSSGGSGTTVIEYTITSLTTAVSGPYTGLKIATVNVKGSGCNEPSLICTSVEVVDHSGCIFDEETMAGYTGWASRGVFHSLDTGDDAGTATPCHWFAINRCCEPDSGTYRDCPVE